MEEARLFSVETRMEAGKVLRVSCSASALFCLFSMNDYISLMQLYSHVICSVNETSFRTVGEPQLVERYIDALCLLLIRISRKL